MSFATYQSVSARSLAINTIKTYECCIRKLMENLSDAEKAEYVGNDGKLIKPLDGNIACNIIHLSQIKSNIDGEITFKSKTCCEQYVSALKYWHGNSNRLRPRGAEPIIISPETEDMLKQYMSGNRRVTVQQRADGNGDADPGKLPLSFAGYRLLARYALCHSRTAKQALLTHSYLTLCWNLMARSNTVFNLLWNNFGWNGDCLTILYEKSKTNQEGENRVPRHVYANPDDPVICPILALGLKVCSEETSNSDTFEVFPAETADSSFANWFKKVLSVLSEDELNLIDVPIERISSHSLRKGGATYVFGITDGPDSDSVKFRMEHKIGGTDDRYIFRRAGDDKYVGRAVSGLDENSFKFSVLPPHFKVPTSVVEVIPECIYHRASNSLRAAFPYLVASVIYHWDWLVENLPNDHPFFTSQIYTRNYKRVWGHLIVTGFFENKQSLMRSSGLPKYVNVLSENEKTRDEIRAIPDAVVSKISSANNVQIYNTEVINREFGHRFENIENFIAANYTRSPINRGFEHANSFRTFFWGGQFNAFPEDFKIPCEPAVKIWKLWLFGDENRVNTPYRMLRGEFMSKAQRVQLSRAKSVMDIIRENIGLSYAEISNLGIAEATRLFKEEYTEILGSVKFHATMTCSNAYKHLIRIRKNAISDNNNLNEIDNDNEQ